VWHVARLSHSKWLSFQTAYSSGLASAQEQDLRASIVCVHGAPDKLIATLRQEWAAVDARTAHVKLASSDVIVTNESDKQTQLPKILLLDDAVRDLKLERVHPSSVSEHGVDRTTASPLEVPMTSTNAASVQELRLERATLKMAIAQRDERLTRATAGEAAANERAMEAMEQVAALKQKLECLQQQVDQLDEENLELQRRVATAVVMTAPSPVAIEVSTSTSGRSDALGGFVEPPGPIAVGCLSQMLWKPKRWGRRRTQTERSTAQRETAQTSASVRV